jgi:hypothetical protein
VTVSLKPTEFVCFLSEAPPGPFLYNGQLCLKTSLKRPNGTVLAFVQPGHEWTLGDDVVVQPVRPEWGGA